MKGYPKDRQKGPFPPVILIVLGIILSAKLAFFSLIFVGIGAALFFMFRRKKFQGFDFKNMVNGPWNQSQDQDFNQTPAFTQSAKPSDPEHVALRLAQEGNGVVTPALLALEANMGIAEAEKILQDLASRGHASMEVTREGRVEYLFADFLPRREPNRYIDN
jgi:hypothetical protein